MSGNTNYPENLCSIIEQIKISQANLLKVVEEHNSFVNKSLDLLQKLKTETKVEIIKVKDSLEELKKLKKEFDNSKLDLSERCYHFLPILVNILHSFGKDKISASFKEIFMEIFTECMKVKREDIFLDFKLLKERILTVRDIRWLLLEMEKYPKFFNFFDVDLELMKEHDASRDNIYLVKKFLTKDGDYEEHYPEEEGGGIKLKYHMTDGVLNGEYKKFYLSGKIKEETSYTKGQQDNVYKVWYEDGQQFVEGKITGENIQWYENGNIMNKYFRLDGKLEGEYTEWYKDGSLWIVTTHKDNKIYGDYECYFPNGKLHQKMFCLGGLLKKDYTFFQIDGEFNQWYEDGSLHINCHYKNGALDGEYKEFYPDGSKKAIRNYKDGQPSGITETWYENGIRSVYAEYNKGLVHGVYNAWYENGNPLYETNHLYGKRHGVCKDYYSNGQLSMIKNYINGVQVGEYKCWYKDGKLSLDIVYRADGKLIKSEHWNQLGILTSKKLLIEFDTYQLSRYYECDGKLHEQVIVEGDKWNGKYNSWWHDGNKCIETTYKNDKRHGEYLFWNEDGTLREKRYYN